MTYFSQVKKDLMNREQRHELLEELFKHATESIIVTDHSGDIKFVNPATERFFGYKQEELMGKKVELLMPERFTQGHAHHREKFDTHPHSRSMGIGMDLYALRRNGTEFPVEISLSPFKHDNEHFTIAFIIDITTRKKTESFVLKQQRELENLAKELRSSNERLESKVDARTKVLSEALNELEKSKLELSDALEKEKELNELKGRFISMASHEFRTPLTTILSSASLIPEYPLEEQKEKRLKHVDRIKSAVNNLNDILSDFLSMSKIEEGKVLANFTVFNLKALVEEIVGDMKALAKPGQKIIYHQQGLEQVTLDQKLVRNIIINLLSNAIKFSDDHKTILISTIIDQSIARIIVKDEGIGISDEDKKHLFERFFRAHNAMNIQGTGLGLNIVANYVELLNGFIEMESELDIGTSFTLTFPNASGTSISSTGSASGY